MTYYDSHLYKLVATNCINDKSIFISYKRATYNMNQIDLSSPILKNGRFILRKMDVAM